MIKTELSLSAAIRLGAMLHPQCFGKLFQHERFTITPPYKGAFPVCADQQGNCIYEVESRITATCALGAANVALGENLLQASDDNLELRYPWVHIYVRCPACPPQCEHMQTVLGTIAHLNDSYKWSRERIADWVQTIEPLREGQHDSQRASSQDQDQTVRPEDSLHPVEV